MAWKVPDQTSRAGARVAPMAVAMMRSARRSISAAARREKVSNKMRPGFGAVDDQVGDAVRQGAGLAGARTGNHQQGPGDVRAVRSDAMLDGTALRGVQGIKIGHEVIQPGWSGPRLSMIRCPRPHWRRTSLSRWCSAASRWRDARVRDRMRNRSG